MEFNWVSVIGIVAACCTTFAYLPQSIKTIKTKHTKDLSIFTLLLLINGTILWLIYGIMDKDIPVILANTVSMVLISTILIYKIRYK